ncbi:MAG: transketolase C-terminal domain-containing protein, partial [Flavobacterium sp.]
IHDVALQNLPVIFCLDRAGLVGEDGATHHGVFDIAYLRCIPNLTIYAPLNEGELRNILYTVQLGINHPIAIRYPRGRGETIDWKTPYKKLAIGKANCLKNGTKIAILSTGTIGNNVTKALAELEMNTPFAHYDFSFIKPLDEVLLHAIFKEFETIITVEDGAITGGFGSAILEFSAKNNFYRTIKTLGIPDMFIEHGSVKELQYDCKIDVKSLKAIFSVLQNELICQ